MLPSHSPRAGAGLCWPRRALGHCIFLRLHGMYMEDCVPRARLCLSFHAHKRARSHAARVPCRAPRGSPGTGTLIRHVCRDSVDPSKLCCNVFGADGLVRCVYGCPYMRMHSNLQVLCMPTEHC